VSALERQLDELRQARSAGAFRAFRLPSRGDILGRLRGLAKTGSAASLDLESAGKKDLLGGSSSRNGGRWGALAVGNELPAACPAVLQIGRAACEACTGGCMPGLPRRSRLARYEPNCR
jgi:hypothetical protein